MKNLYPLFFFFGMAALGLFLGILIGISLPKPDTVHAPNNLDFLTQFR